MSHAAARESSAILQCFSTSRVSAQNKQELICLLTWTPELGNLVADGHSTYGVCKVTAATMRAGELSPQFSRKNAKNFCF